MDTEDDTEDNTESEPPPNVSKLIAEYESNRSTSPMDWILNCLILIAFIAVVVVLVRRIFF